MDANVQPSIRRESDAPQKSAGSAPLLVRRIFRDADLTGPDAEWNERVKGFYRAANLQKKIAEAGYCPPGHREDSPSTGFVARIQEFFPKTEEEAFTQSDARFSLPYRHELKSLLAGGNLTHEFLFNVVCGIAAGLHQIQLVENVEKRAHGNLKLTSVLLRVPDGRRRRKLEVCLTDLPDLDLFNGKPPAEQKDLCDLGRIILELASQREIPVAEWNRITPDGIRARAEWKKIDQEKGPRWCDLCSRLSRVGKEKTGPQLTLEDLFAELERLDRARPVPWKVSGLWTELLRLPVALVDSWLGWLPQRWLRWVAALIALAVPITLALVAMKPLPAGSRTGVTKGLEVTPGTNVDLLVTNLGATPGQSTQLNLRIPRMRPFPSYSDKQTDDGDTNLVEDSSQSPSGSTNADVSSPGSSATRQEASNSITPQVTIHMYPSNSVSEGTTVTLTAEVESQDGLLIRWQKNGADVEGQLNKGWTLGAVTTDHNGKYSAKVTRNGITSTSEPVELSVIPRQKRPPQFTKRLPEHRLAEVGETVLLSVSVDDTSANISWFMFSNNIPVVQLSGTNELRLVNVKKTHGGRYAVVAENGDGSVTNLTDLMVQLPSPDFGPENVNIDLEVEKRTNLVAKVDHADGVGWYLNDRRESTDSSYLFTAPATSQLIKLEVRATNEDHSGTQYWNVQIVEPPSSPPKVPEVSGLMGSSDTNGVRGIYARYNSVTTLKATANSERGLKFAWYQDGKHLKTTDEPRYDFTPSAGTSGKYEVVATNKAGQSASYSFYVWVDATNEFGMEFVWVPNVPEMKDGTWVAKNALTMDQYDEVMKPKSKQDKTRNDTNEVMKSKSKQVIARNNTNDFRGTLSDATKFLLALNKTSPQFNSTGSYTLPSMNQFKSYGGDATPIEEPLAGKTAKSDKQMKPNRFGIYLPDNPAEIFAKATAGQSSSGGFFNSLAAKIGSLPKALIGDNRGLRVISGEPAGDVHESEP